MSLLSTANRKLNLTLEIDGQLVTYYYESLSPYTTYKNDSLIATQKSIDNHALAKDTAVYNKQTYEIFCICVALTASQVTIQDQKKVIDKDSNQNADPGQTFSKRSPDYDRTDEKDQFVSVLKRDTNRFLTFETTKLKFVDVREFLH